MIHNHLVIQQEMRSLAIFFHSFFLPVDSFFPEEVKHVFHGLRPARGLVLFIVIIRGLAGHVSPGSLMVAEHSCLERMLQEPPSVLRPASPDTTQTRLEGKAVLRLTNEHPAP